MGRPEMRLLLRRLLCLDINQIPRMFSSFWSSLVEQQLLENSIAAKTKSNRDSQLEIDLHSGTDSNINTSLSSYRRPVRRNSSFGQFFILLPPQTRKKKIQEGNHMPKRRNDE